MAKITTQLFGELAILPHQAEAPVRETLEFLTDVFEAYDGTEQRLQLRTKARQTFSYTVPLQSWNIAKAFNTEYGAIRKKWAVPIWTEAQNVGNVNGVVSFIVCDTTLYDLRNASLAMLYVDEQNWKVVEIVSVESGLITLSEAPPRMIDAWLMPVRIGYIANNIEQPTNGHSGKFSAVFEIEDSPYIEAPIPDQFLNNDVCYDAGLLNGSDVSRTIEQQFDKNDFDLGKVEYRTNWTNARVATPYRRVFENAYEVHSFKSFLYRRAGKFRAFWMPSFSADVNVLNSGLINAVLFVSSDSYVEYASKRTHIAVQTKSGAWLLRTISAATQIDANSVQLTLSSILNIRADTIYRVCYLGLHRLDADRIEFNWVGNGVAETEVRILELKP